MNAKARGWHALLWLAALILGIGAADAPACAPYTLAVSANPVVVCHDGGTSAVTAAVTVNGNPAAGHTIQFSVSGPADPGSVDPSSAATGAGGQATTTYTAGTNSGAITITAQDTTQSGQPTATSSLDVIKLEITPTATNACKDCTNACEVTYMLTTDSYAPGGVIWASSPAGLSPSGGSGPTFTVDPTNSTPGSYTITVDAVDIASCLSTAALDVVMVGAIVRASGSTNYPPVAFGDSIGIAAPVTPAGRLLTWSITAFVSAATEQLAAIPSDVTVVGSPSPGNTAVFSVGPLVTESGWVKVRAQDSALPACYRETWIRIGCGGCTGYCPSALGSTPGLGSVAWIIPVGTSYGGASAGDIFLFADAMSPKLATPAALEFNSLLVPGVDVVRGPELSPRQIRTPYALIDVTTNNAFSYQITSYPSSQVTGLATNGLYTLNPGATPQTTWRVSNPAASTNDIDKLLIERITGAGTNAFEYTWVEATDYWTLSKGNGLVVETLATTIAGADEIQTRVLQDAASVTSSIIRTTSTLFPWGREDVESVVDPDGAALTSSMAYYEDISQTGQYSYVQSEIRPDGSWTRYEYDSSGRPSVVVRPWLDNPTGTVAALAQATYYDYAPLNGSDTAEPRDALMPRKETRTVLGITTGISFTLYTTNAAGARVMISERAASAADAFGSTNNLRTTTTYLGADSYKPETVERPDGTLTTYTYEQGHFNSSPTPGAYTYTVTAGGTYQRLFATEGTVASPAGVAYETTRHTTILDNLGKTIVTEEAVYTGGASYARIAWTENALDEWGRVVTANDSTGLKTETVYDCCGVSDVTGRQGEKTLFLYDALERVVLRIAQGLPAGVWPAQADVYTDTGYDAAGRVVKETSSAASLSLISSNVYDLAGRMTVSIDPAGIISSNAYAAGGRIVTRYQPGGAAAISESYLDGRNKSQTGSAVTSQFQQYGVYADGSQWSRTFTGSDGTNSAVWTLSVTDFQGRSIREERPGFQGAVLTNAMFYDAAGRLVRSTTPGQADTLYEYDELGQQVRAGFDINGNGVLDLNGPDRISDSDTRFVMDAGTWWRRSSSATYATDGSAVATTNGIQKSRLTGLSTNLTSESISIDIFGNATVSQTAVDRGSKTVTSTVDTPDSDTDSVSISVNGLAVSSKGQSGHETTMLYDALRRRTSAVDPRIGASTTHYNVKGQVDYVEDAASNRTSFAYESETGRRVATTNALGLATRQEYDERGRVVRTWGESTYPVAYGYDDLDRMVSMSTYRDGSGWEDSLWPSNTLGTADTTLWQYDDSTGLLTNKLYADGNGTGYGYTPENQLATRTWARGVTTTYAYTNTTGELVGIAYSDATADIAFTYDRLGRQLAVEDAQGERAFGYDPQTLLLTNETIAAASQTNVIARTYDSLGRSSGLALGAGYQVSYAYSSVGRFDSVTSAVAGKTNDWQYAYVPDSELLSALVQTQVGITNSRAYEPNRNLISEVLNAAPGLTISRFQYDNDAIGRRTRRIDTAAGVLSTNYFGYNARSEVTNALMSSSTFAYLYDNIGNRESSATNGLALAYLANALNQYTNIANGVTNTLAYDLDGNLVADGAWAYAWNAENRLIAASNATYQLTFAYDYMGRRFSKSDGSTETRFLYDGWNLVTEESGAMTNRYVWGLDLSGSMQGAGGIGGLLATVQEGAAYFSCFDANGNLTDYVGTNGAIEAHYEYGPFGGTIASSGAKKDDFRFRFSTKYYDYETDLYYYGYRYYSPGVGRWVNRDPILEEGGLNVYGFLWNQPVGLYDYLGMTSCPYYYSSRRLPWWRRDRYEVIEVRSVEDILVKYEPLRGALGVFDGYTVTVKEGPCCEISIRMEILISEALPVRPTSGGLYLATHHYAISGRAALGTRSGGREGVETPTRGSVLAHERGHAAAYLGPIRECFENVAAQYCGKPCGASEKSAIEQAYLQCRIQHAEDHARIVNLATIRYFIENGFHFDRDRSRHGYMYYAYP